MSLPTDPFYAVACGRRVGVVRTWDECQELVIGFSGARFKKFPTLDAARAFVSDYATRPAPKNISAKPRKRSYLQLAAEVAPAAKKPRAETTAKFIVFCDGNCLRNGSSSAVAGSGVFCANPRVRCRSLRVPGRQTNSRAELWAMSLALLDTLELDDVLVRSDSEYVVRGLTEASRLERWRRNGWMRANREPLLNRDLWQLISRLLEERGALSLPPVRFEHVRGHSGVAGNEKADELATVGMGKPPLKLIDVQIFPFEYPLQMDPRSDVETLIPLLGTEDMV